MRGLVATPYYVTRPQILMLYNQEFGSLGGHSWSSLAAGIAVRINRQNFFIIEAFLQAELPNYLIVGCFTYHNSALYRLLLLSPINKLQ
jgi:hypothetical protein